MSMGKIVIIILICSGIFIGIRLSLNNINNDQGINPSSVSRNSVKTEAEKEGKTHIRYQGDISRNPLKSPFEDAPKVILKSTPKVKPKPKIDYSFIDDITLQAIIVLPSGPKAIINDRTVSIGESIQGARITKIKEKYVVLKYRGRTFKKILP